MDEVLDSWGAIDVGGECVEYINSEKERPDHLGVDVPGQTQRNRAVGHPHLLGAH